MGAAETTGRERTQPADGARQPVGDEEGPARVARVQRVLEQLVQELARGRVERRRHAVAQRRGHEVAVAVLRPAPEVVQHGAGVLAQRPGVSLERAPDPLVNIRAAALRRALRRARAADAVGEAAGVLIVRRHVRERECDHWELGRADVVPAGGGGVGGTGKQHNKPRRPVAVLVEAGPVQVVVLRAGASESARDGRSVGPRTAA